jgi:hypothetical protein
MPPRPRERASRLIALANSAIGALSAVAVVVVAGLALLAAAAIYEFAAVYTFPCLLTDAALAALAAFLIVGKKRQAQTALGRVDSLLSGPPRQAAAGAAAPAGAGPTSSAPRDVARSLLNMAADSVFGPVLTCVVAAPVALCFAAWVAHTSGHGAVESLCTLLTVISLTLGLGPYCAGRALLSWQVDRLLDSFSPAETETSPLLHA